MELADRVLKTIDKYSMLAPGDKVLIGLSGGPDSVCLSLILDELKDNFNISLHAVYINHGLRPEEAAQEEEFCRAFCAERGMEFHLRRIDLGGSGCRGNLQEMARDMRYRIFGEVSSETGATRVALGHNADDQAETVLMRLVRGSGRRGLSGIPPVRGNIIRPLIETARRDIEQYLRSRGPQPYMTDSSNLYGSYHRNRLRRDIMPLLRELNPSVVEDICRCADIFRDEDEYLEIEVTKTLMRLISRKNDKGIELFLGPMEVIRRPLLRRVLRRALDSVSSLRGVSFQNIEDIIELILKRRSGDRIILPRNVRAVREYSLLKITSERPVRVAETALPVPGEAGVGEGVTIRAMIEERRGEYTDSRCEVFLDADLLAFPLKVRARADGDYFFPAGFGKKKKLQDYFVDEKVPRDMRDSVPVVLSGDDIIWVAGFRSDDRFRMTGQTERVLRLIISGFEFN
jgi:tRNA(Ile)-lysidine synthase